MLPTISYINTTPTVTIDYSCILLFYTATNVPTAPSHASTVNTLTIASYSASYTPTVIAVTTVNTLTSVTTITDVTSVTDFITNAAAVTTVTAVTTATYGTNVSAVTSANYFTTAITVTTVTDLTTVTAVTSAYSQVISLKPRSSCLCVTNISRHELSAYPTKP